MTDNQPYDPTHPKHYADMHPEPIDVIRAWGLNFNLGAVVKHVARAGRKGPPMVDLKKASTYLQHEMDVQTAEEAKRLGDIDPRLKAHEGRMEARRDPRIVVPEHVRPLRREGETTAQFLERLSPTDFRLELKAMLQWAAAHGMRIELVETEDKRHERLGNRLRMVPSSVIRKAQRQLRKQEGHGTRKADIQMPSEPWRRKNTVTPKSKAKSRRRSR